MVITSRQQLLFKIFVFISRRETTIFYQKVPICQTLNHLDGISCAQLPPLLAADYIHSPPSPIAKITAHLLITIADNEDKLADTSFPWLQ
jgi:hypothetical protein